MLIGEETMRLARREILFGERQAVVLKGKAEIVSVYSAIKRKQRPGEGEGRGRRISLVGRTNELTLLSSIWAKVVQEMHPHLVTVLGEAGIGKSRLVAEFESSLLNKARILHGRCLPYGEALGYWALANVVKEAAALPGLAPQQYEQRLQVLIDLAEVRYWLSDTPSTRQYATEALKLAEQVGREEFAASAIGALAIADVSDGVVHASLDQYQRALARAGKNLLPTLYWFEQYGLTLYWTGNYEAAIERSQQAIESAWKAHDTTTIARALGNLGMGLTGRGRYDEA